MENEVGVKLVRGRGAGVRHDLVAGRLVGADDRATDAPRVRVAVLVLDRVDIQVIVVRDDLVEAHLALAATETQWPAPCLAGKVRPR